MVTLQILVLSFQVRILVAQQRAETLSLGFFVYIPLHIPPIRIPIRPSPHKANYSKYKNYNLQNYSSPIPIIFF